MKKCRIFVVIPTTRLTGRKSEIPRTVAALGIQVSFVDKKDAGPKPLRRNGFLVFQASSSELLTAFLNCTINGTDCKE